MELKQMFQAYLAELFPETAEFEDNGRQTLRITYPLAQTSPGSRYSRPVDLVFDEEVIAGFRAAIDANNVARQDRFGDLLEELVRTCLSEYDEAGPIDTAFQIDIDRRVLDL